MRIALYGRVKEIRDGKMHPRKRVEIIEEW
jgi:hypothetical protein